MAAIFGNLGISGNCLVGGKVCFPMIRFPDYQMRRSLVFFQKLLLLLNAFLLNLRERHVF